MPADVRGRSRIGIARSAIGNFIYMASVRIVTLRKVFLEKHAAQHSRYCPELDLI
jgi:hypothetical protein